MSLAALRIALRSEHLMTMGYPASSHAIAGIASDPDVLRLAREGGQVVAHAEGDRGLPLEYIRHKYEIRRSAANR
jgi:hypothetical protein